MSVLTVAVAGATGLTGGHLLNALLDAEQCGEVHALVRRPLHRPHPKLQEHVADFAKLDLALPAPLTAAFCCLGTTIRKAGSKAAFRAVDQDAVLAFARWAREQGATHFLLVSSVAASPSSPNFYLRVKGETEQELEKLGFASLDIFQPSFLLGARAESRPGERMAQIGVELLAWAMLGPLEKYRGVRAQDVALAMLRRAEEPVAGVHRHLYGAITALVRSAATHAPPR